MDFQEFTLNRKIHFGESEGLSICKNRNGVFLTNDSEVVIFCEINRIKVLNLKDILIFISQNKIILKNEMMIILRDIEEKDNTVIRGKEVILENYNL